MHNFVENIPVSIVAMIGGFGFLQSLVQWSTPTLQFIILLGSAILVVWKVWLVGKQIYSSIKNSLKKKK